MSTPDIQAIRTLVKFAISRIHVGATEQGMDISPRDVGWIVSNFIETALTGEQFNQEFNANMQAIADEAAATVDEG